MTGSCIARARTSTAYQHNARRTEVVYLFNSVRQADIVQFGYLPPTLASSHCFCEFALPSATRMHKGYLHHDLRFEAVHRLALPSQYIMGYRFLDPVLACNAEVVA